MLDAAARLFADRGVDRTSLADIGVEAGYSRGLPSHHFGSKAVLVDRLLTRSHLRFLDRLEVADVRSAAEAILVAVDSYVHHFLDPSSESRTHLVLWAGAFPLSVDRTAIQAINERSIVLFEELVTSGQEDGSVALSVDARVFAVTLLALLRGAGGQLLADPSPERSAELREGCRKLVGCWLQAG